MRLHPKPVLLIALMYMVLLSACQPPDRAPALTPTPEPTSLPATQTPLPLPTFTPLPSATPAGCQETRGSIQPYVISETKPPTRMNLYVYLPPCYGQDPARHYPVLILIHGQSQDEGVWKRLGVDLQADRLIAEGAIAPLIIVMPREEYYLQEPAESTFGKTVIQVLIPWVDRTFNTLTQQKHRAIGGISRGAYWATILGWENWQLFGAIGAHSLPNIPFYEVAFRDLNKTIPETQRPEYYMDHGVVDGYLRDANEWHNLLVKYMVAHTWVSSVGGHNEDYWRAQMGEYLLWYAAPWIEEQ